MQDVLRALDIVVKATNREHISHVGGWGGGGGGGVHLTVTCFEHDDCLLFCSANRNPIPSKYVQKRSCTCIIPRFGNYFRSAVL